MGYKLYKIHSSGWAWIKKRGGQTNGEHKKRERFVSSKNCEQFAILTKQKTLTRYKSAFYSMKKGEQRSPFAEREGFEPPVPLSTAVFKTAVIDHSTISPSD